jgi:hypothetical protein
MKHLKKFNEMYTPSDNDLDISASSANGKLFNEASATRIGDKSKVGVSDFSSEYVDSLVTIEDCERAINEIENQIEELHQHRGRSTYGRRMQLQGRIDYLKDKISEISKTI